MILDPETRGMMPKRAVNETTALLIESNVIAQETEAMANGTLTEISDQRGALDYIIQIMTNMMNTNRQTVEETRNFAETARSKTRTLWAYFIGLSTLNLFFVIRIILNGRIL
jgi:hypothetical protein